MKPVYIINGFLESGKTEFICYTLGQPYFRIKGSTLLIVCEEGENEYSQELLSKTKTVMEVIEDECDKRSWKRNTSRKGSSLSTTVCGTSRI